MNPARQYTFSPLPGSIEPGAYDLRPLSRTLAEEETQAILDLRDTEAEIFIHRGWRTFWFDLNDRWKALGRSSLDDWAEHHNLTHSTVHDGKNAIDVLFFFFDLPLDMMMKVGQKKMSLLLPIWNQLRFDALVYAGADQGIMWMQYQEAQRQAFNWLKRAVEESWTRLKEDKPGNTGWVKYGSREDKKTDLLYVMEYDEATGQEYQRERTVRELLELFDQLDLAQDDQVLRVSLFGPDTSKTLLPSPTELVGQKLQDAAAKNGARGCPNCQSGMVHVDREARSMTCQQCGWHWDYETGETLLPVAAAQ